MRHNFDQVLTHLPFIPFSIQRTPSKASDVASVLFAAAKISFFSYPGLGVGLLIDPNMLNYENKYILRK